MKSEGPFGVYTDHECFQIGFCTLGAKTAATWRSDHPAQFLVATRDLCHADTIPLPRHFPSPNLHSGVEVSNTGPRIALLFTLALAASATLIFFGSRAQGTHLPTSDIDLLIIAPNCDYVGSNHGLLSLYTISPEEAQARAERGDLFFGSLLQTGEVLFDPMDRFATLRAAYTVTPQPKAIQTAKLIGTLMLQDGLFTRHAGLVIGRALWCFRTIMLAEGQDLFSHPPTANEDDLQTHALLIAARNNNPTAQAAAFDAFVRFLTARDLVEDHWLHKELDAWDARFEAENDPIGIKTIAAIKSSNARNPAT